MSEESKRTPFGGVAAAAESTDEVGVNGAEEGAEALEIERLTAELAAMTLEAERQRDAFLRERAEVENFKKRMQRERGEWLRFAAEPIVRELLPVIDNLERAVGHSAAADGENPLVDGVRMVLKSALAVLENHGVSRVEADGQSFDPHLHEAIAQVDDPSRAANEVVQQFLPGYRLHERLLRPAQVSVATNRAPPANDDEN